MAKFTHLDKPRVEFPVFVGDGSDAGKLRALRCRLAEELQIDSDRIAVFGSAQQLNVRIEGATTWPGRDIVLDEKHFVEFHNAIQEFVSARVTPTEEGLPVPVIDVWTGGRTAMESTFDWDTCSKCGAQTKQHRYEPKRGDIQVRLCCTNHLCRFECRALLRKEQARPTWWWGTAGSYQDRNRLRQEEGKRRRRTARSRTRHSAMADNEVAHQAFRNAVDAVGALERETPRLSDSRDRSPGLPCVSCGWRHAPGFRCGPGRGAADFCTSKAEVDYAYDMNRDWRQRKVLAIVESAAGTAKDGPECPGCGKSTWTEGRFKCPACGYMRCNECARHGVVLGGCPPRVAELTQAHPGLGFPSCGYQKRVVGDDPCSPARQATDPIEVLRAKARSLADACCTCGSKSWDAVRPGGMQFIVCVGCGQLYEENDERRERNAKAGLDARPGICSCCGAARGGAYIKHALACVFATPR